MNLKFHRNLFTYLLVVITAVYSNAFAQQNYISSHSSASEDFVIVSQKMNAVILVDNNDYKGIQRVAGHLQKDILNVTSKKIDLITSISSKLDYAIIIGSIEKSEIIKDLIEKNKIDVSTIEDQWERYKMVLVDNPLPNVKKALVIAGSDKRGTIYGIYNLSENIGVSPWYWWSDVAVKKKTNLFINNVNYTSQSPKVKYRGIFINDEAPALRGWAYENYGDFNAKFYDHVFELILRLKGNFLWPAMWGESFYDDDPESPKLADEYGVVISTSHHEPLMRSHDEWSRYGEGEWNYKNNAENLRKFWRKGIERMGDNESIVTLAMRGDGDMPMSEGANISLLEKIVHDQREIIKDVTQKDITETPQVWALYKEVQQYYDNGMRVDDDITLLFCDDNWGNVRRLPNLESLDRAGGYGMYYHFDYVGGPRNYKWLNTNPIARIWEQMNLSYNYGVDRIWVVNVGDIKPMEFSINFFLDYAWDPDAISHDDLTSYTVNWCKEQFGEKYATEIAHLVTKYLVFNSRRKPEMLSDETYSLIHFREAENYIKEYKALYEEAVKISSELPKSAFDGFYQLVLHPIEACSNLNEMYYAVAKNKLYAKQERAATNVWASKVQETYERDAEITDFYHNELANGKWNHMMSQTHIGYTYWQQPDENSIPKVEVIENENEASMGVMAEGSCDWWPESDKYLTLPEYDSFNKQSYYIEVFNQGMTSFKYSCSTSNDWIIVDNPAGNIDFEKRIFVSIDWDKVPNGKSNGTIKITGSGSESALIELSTNNYQNQDNIKGFIESNGYISIEAENFTQKEEPGNFKWIVIPDFGKTKSGVSVSPIAYQNTLEIPKALTLKYDIHLFSKGKAKVKFYFSPTLDFTSNGLRFATSLNNEDPIITNVYDKGNQPNWGESVGNNIIIQTVDIEITKSCNNVLNYWLLNPGLVLQKIVIETSNIGQTYLGPTQSYLIK